MKNGSDSTKRKGLALFVATMLLASLWTIVSNADDSNAPPWDVPARAARRKNPVAADGKSLAQGKIVYIAQCLKCHGDAGKGDGPSAKDLNPHPKNLGDPKVAGQTDGALFYEITTGRKPMPAFEQLLSEDDRWNVINYVRKIAPPPASQPSDGK
jgi:mono/diheme cytochrome c family protein